MDRPVKLISCSNAALFIFLLAMERSFIPIPITLAVLGHALVMSQITIWGWSILALSVVIAVGGFIFEVVMSLN